MARRGVPRWRSWYVTMGLTLALALFIAAFLLDEHGVPWLVRAVTIAAFPAIGVGHRLAEELRARRRPEHDPAAKAAVRCHACGGRNEWGMMFCRHCERRLVDT